ncbi:MAG TPA: hypothetical protein VII72_07635 [Myxococcota bacterium]
MPVLRLAALAAYALLLILRAPRIWPGRFWAEEGTVFFSAAWSDGLLKSLLLPRGGYYMAVTSFATTLAARAVPLEHAPLVTTGIAAAIQLLPAWLLVTVRIDALPDSLSRAIALALLLVALPSEEIWLSSTNSSHFLGVAAGILLIARPAASRARLFHLGLLVLAGLSGIDANLLAPFFWLRAYQERSRERLEQAAALSACALLQALVVLISPHYGFAPVGIEGARSPGLEPQILAHAVLAKDILLPFAGRAWTEHVMAPLAQTLTAGRPALLVPAIVIAWAGVFALAVVKGRQWQPRILLGLSLFVVLVSFTAALEASRPDWHLTHTTALGAGRYYYLPNFFLGLALLMTAWTGSALRKSFRVTALVLVAWMLVVGSYEFFASDARRWFFRGPDWQHQVAAWRRGETDDLKIWPAPWKISLERTSRTHPE